MYASEFLPPCTTSKQKNEKINNLALKDFMCRIDKSRKYFSSGRAGTGGQIDIIAGDAGQIAKIGRQAGRGIVRTRLHQIKAHVFPCR